MLVDIYARILFAVLASIKFFTLLKKLGLMCHTRRKGRNVTCTEWNSIIANLILTCAVIILAVWLCLGKRMFLNREIIGSSVTTNKVHGAAKLVNTANTSDWEIWDSVDLTAAVEDGKRVFITTKILTTRNQTRGTCSELLPSEGDNCTVDDDCSSDRYSKRKNWGELTGTCNLDTNTCNMYAWCPIEDSKVGEDDATLHMSMITKAQIVNNTEDILIAVRNEVYFPIENGSDWTVWTNSSVNLDSQYACQCVHNISDVTDNCPFFRLADIIQHDRDHILHNGGVALLRLDWTLDVDDKEWDLKYSFVRTGTGAGGYGYTDAVFNGKNRHLKRFIGILLVVETNARAYETSEYLVVLHFGALCGLLQVGTSLAKYIKIWSEWETAGTNTTADGNEPANGGDENAQIRTNTTANVNEPANGEDERAPLINKNETRE